MAIEELLLDEALEGLIGLAATREPTAVELARSASGFLGAARADDAQRAAAARRHAEWFLLERPSDETGGSQLEVLRDELLEERPELADALDALRGSFAGVFRISGVQPGEGVWVRDLAGLGEYALQEVEGSAALEAGDLLVGRLFPVGDGLHRVSRAAGCFRNAELASALERDLERVRGERRGVLRLAQSELETMFFGEERRSGEDAARRAREVLVRGGLPAERAEAAVDDLLQRPFDPERLTPGTGDALGELLDQLAFETDVDLGAARAALIEAWTGGARNAEGPGARSGAPQRAAAEALAAFDRGREEGRDLEQLFDELERDLELEPDEVDDPDPVPDFPGVVGAMVVEFLWQTDREHGTELAARYRVLESFARFGAEYGVFENLGRRELLGYCTLWLPEQGGLASADEARATLAALRAFCAWASAEQQVELEQAYETFRAGVERSLPRVTEANACREGGPEGGDSRVLAYEDGGRARDAQGHSVDLRLPAGMADWLAEDDLVRVARAEDGSWCVRCVYPPEGALLAEE